MSVGMGSFSQADPDRMVQMAQTLATAKGIEFPEYGNEGMQLHGNGYSASLVGLTDEDGIDFATNSIFENSQSLASFARNTLGLGDDDVSFLGSLDSGQIAFLKTEVREILMNNSPEAAAPAPTAEASQGTEAQSANTSPAAAAPAPTSEQNVQSQSASSTDNTRRTEGNSKSLLDRLKDAFMSFIDNCRFGKVFHHNKAAGAAVTKLLIEKFWGFFDEKDIPSDITFNITNAPRDSDSMLQALEMRIPHEETTETPSDATIASHREAIITGLESEVAALRAAADGHPPPPGMESTQAAADLKSLEGRISGKEPFQPSDMRFVAQKTGQDIAIISQTSGVLVLHLCTKGGEYKEVSTENQHIALRDSLVGGRAIFVQENGYAGHIELIDNEYNEFKGVTPFVGDLTDEKSTPETDEFAPEADEFAPETDEFAPETDEFAPETDESKLKFVSESDSDEELGSYEEPTSYEGGAMPEALPNPEDVPKGLPVDGYYV